MSGPPEVVPDDVPPDVPPARAKPGMGATLAAGCAGFIVFYIGAFALVIGMARADATGAAVVGALILIVAVTVVKNAGAGGRAILARVAVGVAVAALVFGGCLALVTGGKIRIGG